MARILEGVFVLGCSLVGFGINALESNPFQDRLQSSVQLVMNDLQDPAKDARRLAAKPLACVELLIMKHVF